MSAAARVGGYYAMVAARAGASVLVTRVCEVIGQLVGLGDTGEGVHVSGVAIAAACFERGVRTLDAAGRERPPSSGVVTDALALLRAIGVTSWERAYSTRWDDEIPPGAIRVEWQGEERGFRFPPRRLALVGYAETIARAAALVAIPIDAVRGSAESCAAAPDARSTALVPPSASRELVPPSLPIASARVAAERPPPERNEIAEYAAACVARILAAQLKS